MPRFVSLSRPVMTLVIALLTTSLVTTACSADPDAKASDAKGSDAGTAKLTADQGFDYPAADAYSATVRWTEHGVPHVLAKTLDSAVFGQAYANAKLNLCTVADIVLMANSQRARYLGEGPAAKWVESDFAQLSIGVRKRAEDTWATLPESGRRVLIAYAAGYNHYLSVTPAAELPSRCRGKAWVKPLSPIDLMTYYYTLALQAGSRNFVSYIGLTNPPKIDTTDARILRQPLGRTQADWLGRYTDYAGDVMRGRVFGMPKSESIGSNGWAVGSELSDNGKGMVLGNPHFPWFGELRFYENHLTVTDDPDFGELDVYGGSLIGVPGVQIGFTKGFGWTHTVSFSAKFTFYKLKLKKGDPFTYLVDGKERKITGREVSVEVKQTDGTMKTLKRMYYRSEVGVMAALPAVGEWTQDSAFTIRDGNETNHQMLDHFLAMDRVQSVAEARKVLTDVQGMPWVNLMGADASGKVLFSDACAEPFLSKAALAQHAKSIADGDFLTEFAFQLGAFLLDGSQAHNDWQVDPDGAREPGLVPCGKVPMLERQDYVANANESHWLTNAAAPLTGFAAVFGREETVRSLRTRMGLHLLTTKGDAGVMGTDGKLSLPELQSVVHDGWAMSAVLLKDQVVSLCGAVTSVVVKNDVVATQAGCQALAQWDGHFKADSKGAVLFREWFTEYDESTDSKALWISPFDVSKPIATPNTLNVNKADKSKSLAMLAFGTAIARLNEQKIPLDVALGDLQYTMKGGKRLPIPGATHGEGAFNVIGWSKGRDGTTFDNFAPTKSVNSQSGLTTQGYPVNYGSSFVMALQFTDKGPQARTLVTYSQSAEPDSKWHDDQTKMFAARTWKTARFVQADIEADTTLVTETLPKN